MHPIRLWLCETRERFAMWIAWRLPRRLAYWATIRVGAHATTGSYSNTADLTLIETLKRWD